LHISEQIAHLLATYGYLAIALIIMLESMGVPLPGETTLITASIYAGTSHHLQIGLVILAATAGAVIGDNLGYWIGDKLGYRFLLRYGARLGMTEGKIKLGQYLFQRHGGKVVFFGRFVAVLRVLAALLAGVNLMPWRRFFIANLCGALVWSATFGGAAYSLGNAVLGASGPVGAAAIVVAVVAVGIGLLLIRRYETRLEQEAERALPGPLRLR
jgi:membrane protein DedA with SNARE-associated domain